MFQVGVTSALGNGCGKDCGATVGLHVTFRTWKQGASPMKFIVAGNKPWRSSEFLQAFAKCPVANGPEDSGPHRGKGAGAALRLVPGDPLAALFLGAR